MAHPMTKDQEPALQKRAVIYLRVSTSEQVKTDFDADGLSIRAQREACGRMADQLGAAVVDEYVDRGESAKSAARPALQEMLKRLRAEADVDYVIVHKVDRLARSREDDIAIAVAIRQAGAQLVSATENIDQTPQGKLLHGIMATIAEFYSANLATEAKKGMFQKAKSGGTPGLAPLGYLNIRQRVDGKEIRTVVVDEERAPHIRWVFTEYATGNWSMKELAHTLNKRGLRTRAIGAYPEREVLHTHVEAILKNPYYTGVVTYDGVEYPGRHEALISRELFEQVQAIRESRGKSREKIHKHPHYLKGSLVCGYCSNRLGVTKSRGNGGIYPYFYCLGRQGKRAVCSFRYVLMATVEARVEEQWQAVQLTPTQISGLRKTVLRDLGEVTKLSAEERSRQEKRLARLAKQRAKAKEAYYSDAIPLEDFRDEQRRIFREETEATKIISRCNLEYEELKVTAEDVLALLGNAYALYQQATPTIRRMLNQAVFAHIAVFSNEAGVVARGARTEGFAGLTGDKAGGASSDERKPLADIQGDTEPLDEHDDRPVFYRRTGALSGAVLTAPEGLLTDAEAMQGATPGGVNDERAPWAGRGSKDLGLVPPSGFEPPLPP